MSLRWRGDEVQRRVERATRLGIDETTSACVNRSKVLAPVKTATLQGSIQMRPAERDARGWVGRWGSFDVRYAIFVEIGTRPHRIDSPVYMPGIGWRYIGLHPGTRPQPYLRPSADAIYPTLPARIRRHIR